MWIVALLTSFRPHPVTKDFLLSVTCTHSPPGKPQIPLLPFPEAMNPGLRDAQTKLPQLWNLIVITGHLLDDWIDTFERLQDELPHSAIFSGLWQH